MDYLTAQETADKWGVSKRRIQILCGENRIVGAIKMANVWLIPKIAQKPKDERKSENLKKPIIGDSNER